MSINVVLTHDVDILQDLREEWISLHERSAARGAALAWDWIYLWWKHFDHLGTFWLLQARHSESNRLVGLAPLILTTIRPKYGLPWRQIEFVGAMHHHEHLDFIVEQGYESEIIPLFIERLLQHKHHWDVLHLSALTDTPTLELLETSGYQWRENLETEMISPYIALPADAETWLKSLSRNRRWKLRHYRTELDKEYPDKWSIIKVSGAQELDRVFSRLVELHQSKWEARGKPGAFSSQGLRDYFRDLMHSMDQNGWMRLYHMVVDQKTAAVLFAYHYRGRAYNHIAGVDETLTKVPVGHVMTDHSIEQAISEGMIEYAMMWGQEEYKYSFGAKDRSQRSLDFVRNGRVYRQQRAVDFLRELKHSIRH
jgi:hypothetical protein